MAITTYTDSYFDKLFKRNYLPLWNNVYPTADPVMSQTKKTFGTLGGYDSRRPVETTFGGSIGSSSDGTLPDAYHSDFVEPVYTPKRSYARIKLDNLTMEISSKSEWAYNRAFDQENTSKLRSFTRYRAMQFANDGTGILGTFGASAATSGTAPNGQAYSYRITLTDGAYGIRRWFFEPGDYVNLLMNGSTVAVENGIYRIVQFVESTNYLYLATVTATTGTAPSSFGTATHYVILAGSYNAEAYGLLGLYANTTHYGVAETDRFISYKLDHSTENLETEFLTDLVETQDTRTGETPTHILLPPVQYNYYVGLLEDQKRFPVPVDIKPKSNAMTTPDLIARVGYGGIQYAGPQGGIKVVKWRYLPNWLIVAANMNHAEQAHVKKPGFAEKDGTVLMRITDMDAYEARYICYHQNIFNPFHFGFLKVAVPA